MFSRGVNGLPLKPDLLALDFLANNGFNFVRVPTDYRFWTKDFDYFHPDESVFEVLDSYLPVLAERGLHMSLNLHRAPGYCINGNELEKHNLWKDELAQDAFVFTWESFARRYKGVNSGSLSFDLLNEPPDVGQYGFTRDIHAEVMRRTVGAIREIDADREIVLNGIGGGHYAIPELSDLGVTHSGRGYQPMTVSHYHAGWFAPSMAFDPPIYPGSNWNNLIWDKEQIRTLYEPWREVERSGSRVHIGEFGCYNQTPNDVALRWFQDLFELYREFKWGFAFWNFEGAFGIINHGRPGANWKAIDGYQVDADLFDLVKSAMVG